MTQYRNERNGDVVTVPVELEHKYDDLGHWSRVVTEAEAVELKGEALDQALKDADLPTTGSADSKRERLAEHAAQQDDTKENQS